MIPYSYYRLVCFLLLSALLSEYFFNILLVLYYVLIITPSHQYWLYKYVWF